MYGQNKFDAKLSEGYLDFVSGNQSNLTATGITATDAIMIAALAAGSAAAVLAGTLVANAVNHMDDAHSAAGCVFLPQAVKGTHLVCDYTQSPDAHASAHSFKCEGGTGVGAGDVFAKQVVGDVIGLAVATSVETAGTNLVPTSKQLIYTPAAATTNTLGPGSMIHFYCHVHGQWLVKMSLVNQGTGATGAWTVA